MLNVSWPFVLVAVILAAVGYFGTRFTNARRVLTSFPRIMAAIELLVAPTIASLVGNLLLTLMDKPGYAKFEHEVRLAITAFIYLVVAHFAARLVEVWILTKTKKDPSTSLPGLQKGILYSFTYFLAISVFLNLKGFSFTGVYISTGALAAIAAFAMQQTLGDLFSGIALSIERSFKLGDWIALKDGIEGEVVDIDWRSTKLRAWDNTTIVIPNGILAREAFKNYHGSRDKFAPWYEIKIDADIDPDHAKALLSEAVSRCNCVLENPPPEVSLADATTIPYTYMIWLTFPNYPAMFKGRDELFSEIHRTLKVAGLQTAPKIYELRSRSTEQVAS